MAAVLFYLLLVVYLLVCVFLVMVILAQEGKGGGLSSIGSAALGDTLGFSGAETTMRKLTRNVGIAFFVLTLVLTFVGERVAGSKFQRAFADTEAAPAAQQPAPGQPAQATSREVAVTPAAGAPPQGSEPPAQPATAPKPATPPKPAAAPASSE